MLINEKYINEIHKKWRKFSYSMERYYVAHSNHLSLLLHNIYAMKSDEVHFDTLISVFIIIHI